MNVEKINSLILSVKEKLKNETDHHDWLRTKLVPKVSNLRNTLNGSGYSTQMETISHVDISGTSFIIEQIKKTSIFKEVVKDLVENHPLTNDHQNPITQTEFWLETFLNNIIKSELENELDNAKEMKMVMTLKDEFDKIPIPVEIIEFFNGVYIEDNSIKLSKNLEVRQPLSSDLEDAIKRSFVFDTHLSVPSLVAQITTKENGNNVSSYRDNLSTIFRLFRLGSVFVERGLQNKSSVIWPSTRTMSTALLGRYDTHHKYLVKSSESNSLVSFYLLMEAKLNLLKNDAKKSSILMAMSNFNNSLLEPIEPERKLFSQLLV